MEKEKNIIVMVNYYLKQNMRMEKDMKKNAMMMTMMIDFKKFC